jgi:hypothetical protein
MHSIPVNILWRALPTEAKSALFSPVFFLVFGPNAPIRLLDVAESIGGLTGIIVALFRQTGEMPHQCHGRGNCWAVSGVTSRSFVSIVFSSSMNETLGRLLKRCALKSPHIRQVLAAERRHCTFMKALQRRGVRTRGASTMWCHCEEPSLNDLIADPMTRALMARDAVAEADLRRLIDRVRDRFDHGTRTPNRALN